MTITWGAALAAWIRLVTRFRWVYLPLSLAGAALTFHLGSPYSYTIAQTVCLVGFLLVLVAPIAAYTLRRPQARLAEFPQGVATPPDLELLIVAVFGTLVAAMPLSAVDPWRWTWWSIAGSAGIALLLGRRWYLALRWSGVRLEAGGVRYRQGRTVFVPWESRPRLVVVGQAVYMQPGERRIKPTADPVYLAAAIAEYAANPERRAALGTAEEFTRLTTALHPA